MPCKNNEVNNDVKILIKLNTFNDTAMSSKKDETSVRATINIFLFNITSQRRFDVHILWLAYHPKDKI